MSKIQPKYEECQVCGLPKGDIVLVKICWDYLKLCLKDKDHPIFWR